jgi:hypothetical protein
LERPSIVHIAAPLYIHERSSTSGACPCCGSSIAKIAEDRPDLEIIIDIDEGTRDFRHDCDPGLFDAVAVDADLSVLNPIRSSALGLRLIMSEARVTCAQGGSRSSKTQHLLYRSLRQWLLRGSPQGEGLFLGPTMTQAHLLLRKWVLGEEGNPPVCDPRLVTRHTQLGKYRLDDQSIHMIDGFTIHLDHMNRDGGNLAGGSMVLVQLTEAAKVTEKKNWAQVRTRIISSGGTIGVDAVPEPGMWMKQAITSPAKKEEDAIGQAIERGEEHSKAREFLLLELDASDNPWNSKEEAAAALAALVHLDPLLAKRYGQGLDVSERQKSFAPWMDRRRHTFEHEGWDVSRLGLVDVTRAASLMLFPRPASWISTVDVNGWPHTMMCSKFAVRSEVAELIPEAMYGQIDRKHWIWVIFAFEQIFGVDSQVAARHLQTVHGGRFKNCAVVMDGTAMQKGTRAGGFLNIKKGINPGKAYERAGFQVKAPQKTSGGHPGYPGRGDSAGVVRRLFREGGPEDPLDPPGHTRIMINLTHAAHLFDALFEQENEPHSLVPAKWTSVRDEADICSATDVMRYLCWPFGRLDKPDTPRREARFHA